MISIKNLQKRYGKKPVLTGVDLEIESGKIQAVLGPNGSGKTTLIKCMLGMVIPQKGSVHIEGKPVLGKWNYRNHIDYLPQIANFPNNLTVKELINMIADLRGNAPRTEELLERFNLGPFLDQKLGNLSGGTRQKVNIVLTFMFDSPLIILDEPTTGLDPVALLSLKELLQAEKQRGKTILITSHIMSFVQEMADDLIFLLDGKVYFQGTSRSLEELTGENSFEYAIANLLKKSYA